MAEDHSSTVPTGEDRTRLGHLLGPHGVGGGIKVYVLGDSSQFAALRRVFVEGRGWLRVRRVDPLAPGVALHLAGVTTREGAEALRGLNVYADDAELPAPEAGVYYFHELRGLKLRGAGDEELGTVTDVVDAGHQDLLVVTHAHGESFVPFQAPYVTVSLNARGRPASLALTADAPAGLLEGEDRGPEDTGEAEDRGTADSAP